MASCHRLVGQGKERDVVQDRIGKWGSRDGTVGWVKIGGGRHAQSKRPGLGTGKQVDGTRVGLACLVSGS